MSSPPNPPTSPEFSSLLRTIFRIRGAGILLVAGLILTAAGIVLMTVIVPNLKQFPADVDEVRVFEGTMPVIFDPVSFSFLTDLKVTLERHVVTEDTAGRVALVSEEVVLRDDTGRELQRKLSRYPLDRKTMEVVDDYPQEWASLEGFIPRAGLVIGWPIETQKIDYRGWSEDYMDTVPLVFEREEVHTRGDVKTYLFTSASGPRPIDPRVIEEAGLPLELPKDQMMAMVEQTDLDPVVKNLLPTMLDRLPGDTVPLAYYYEYEGQYWIEPYTGVLIDVLKHELRKVGLPDEVLEGTPLAMLPEEQRAALRVPVFDLTYYFSDQSVRDSKKDADDAGELIKLLSRTLPLGGISVGVLMLLAGAYTTLRRLRM